MAWLGVVQIFALDGLFDFVQLFLRDERIGGGRGSLRGSYQHAELHASATDQHLAVVAHTQLHRQTIQQHVRAQEGAL
jgi:hypothetical protein